jgi:hypothetical protein
LLTKTAPTGAGAVVSRAEIAAVSRR